MLRHTRQRIFGNGVNDRDHGKPHHEPDHERIALDVGAQQRAPGIEPQLIQRQTDQPREAGGEGQQEHQFAQLDDPGLPAVEMGDRAVAAILQPAQGPRHHHEHHRPSQRRQRRGAAAYPAIEPPAKITRKQPPLQAARRTPRPRHRDKDQPEQHQKLRPPGVTHDDALGQHLPEIAKRQNRQRNEHERRQHGHDPCLHNRREHEGRDEPEHDAGQRRHGFNRGFDRGAHLFFEELRRVDRGQQRQRHREHQRVERGLERAKNQRDQTELRLKIIRAAGRLPGEAGFLVAFVPDLAEDRLPRRFGMRVVQSPHPRLPGRIHRKNPVRLRGHLEKTNVAARRHPAEHLIAGHVPQKNFPRGGAGQETFVARGKRGDWRRRGVRGQLVGRDELIAVQRPGLRALDAEPGRDTAGRVADDDGLVAEHEAEAGELGAGTGSHFHHFRDGRLRDLAQVVTVHGAGAPRQIDLITLIALQQIIGRRRGGGERQLVFADAQRGLAGHDILTAGDFVPDQFVVAGQDGEDFAVPAHLVIEQADRHARCADLNGIFHFGDQTFGREINRAQTRGAVGKPKRDVAVADGAGKRGDGGCRGKQLPLLAGGPGLGVENRELAGAVEIQAGCFVFVEFHEQNGRQLGRWQQGIVNWIGNFGAAKERDDHTDQIDHDAEHRDDDHQPAGGDNAGGQPVHETNRRAGFAPVTLERRGGRRWSEGGHGKYYTGPGDRPRPGE